MLTYYSLLTTYYSLLTTYYVLQVVEAKCEFCGTVYSKTAAEVETALAARAEEGEEGEEGELGEA